MRPVVIVVGLDAFSIASHAAAPDGLAVAWSALLLVALSWASWLALRSIFRRTAGAAIILRVFAIAAAAPILGAALVVIAAAFAFTNECKAGAQFPFPGASC